MEYTDGTVKANTISLQTIQKQIEELTKKSMYRTGDVIEIENTLLNGYITAGTTEAHFFIPITKVISPDVKSVVVSGSFRFRQNGKYISDYKTQYGFNTGNGTDYTDYFNELGIGIVVKMAGGVAFPNMTNNDCVTSDFSNIKIEFK